MKVTLVSRSFSIDSGQGVYKMAGYLFNKLKEITKINTEKIDMEYTKNNFIFDIIESPFRVFFDKSDIFHFLMPEQSIPTIFKKKTIVTFHDIIPLISSERKNVFRKYFYIMSKIASKATYIIAVSENTKKDLISILKIPEKKISVVQWGVDMKKFHPMNIKKDAETKVLGYLGGLGKRKNVDIIIKVMSNIDDKNIKLKIAGKGPELNRLKKLVNRLKLNNIEFVGFIPEERLPYFYNSLDLFVFPSKYEGFGIPVLEAMACGIPIITSNTSSLLEIVKDKFFTIDPNNYHNLLEKIIKILYNKKVQKRMIESELKRVKNFTWTKCIEETLKVYEKTSIR